MQIKKIQGFRQITPFMVSQDQNPEETLKGCGLDMYAGVNYAMKYNAGIGSMTVLGNTFAGMKFHILKGQTCPEPGLKILDNVNTLKDKALQVGFRLTQQGIAEKGISMLSLMARGTPARLLSVTTLPDDSSVYCELLIYRNATGSQATVSLYINKIRVENRTFSPGEDEPLYLDFGVYNTLRPQGEEGFTFMVGDIYTAEVEYQADKTVVPELLGALTIEPYGVAGYTGDRHANSKNQDIVTALNTLDPGNDMGVLSLKPVDQAAGITFVPPDITGRAILGIGINFVYRDSAAPQNRLCYRISEGETPLAEETITTRQNDMVGFSTYTHLLTAPQDGGEWNADNLPLKVELMNRGTVE